MKATFRSGSVAARESLATASRVDRFLNWYSWLLGAFFGVTILKFGNPPIMEKWVEAPQNVYEILLGSPWPIGWAYLVLGAFVVGGVSWLLYYRTFWPRRNLWLCFLPLAWLVWQAVATSQTLNSDLSVPTFKHFIAIVVCFYAGFFLLSQNKSRGGFWVGILVGFVIMLLLGWQQHFGGLAATREFFYREIYPHLKEVPPEYLKKMSSTRIFSTLFYPNALAGALLLFLPPVLMFIAHSRERFTAGARIFLVCGVALGALGCLYWSGSKGGWLLMLLMAIGYLLTLQFSKSLKILLVAGLLLAGLAGFLWRYVAFFEKGATSVSARFDYWQAALRTASVHPWTGTGPGTFMIPYAAIKRPEAEMTRMVHNDYLEQASDSGWPGFVAYSAFIGGALLLSTRSKLKNSEPGAGNWRKAEPMIFAMWLGVIGWAVQGLFEFGLYIPALAWPAFAFLGWLARDAGFQVDKPAAGR